MVCGSYSSTGRVPAGTGVRTPRPKLLLASPVMERASWPEGRKGGADHVPRTAFSLQATPIDAHCALGVAALLGSMTGSSSTEAGGFHGEEVFVWVSVCGALPQ